MLKKIIFSFRLKAEIKKARAWHKTDGCNYFVVFWDGKPKCIKKSILKKMVAQGKFKKGVTLQELEHKALYTTYSICL